MAPATPEPEARSPFLLVRDLLAFYLEARRRSTQPDRLQTVLTRALTGLPNYQPHPDGPRPWLCAIFRNVELEGYRAAKRELELFRPDLGHAAKTPSPDPSPEEAAWRHEVRSKLLPAIAALPDRLLEVFVLVHVEGLSHSESADLLKIPVGTLKDRDYQALARLRAALGPKENYLTAVPPVPRATRLRALRKLFDLSFFGGHLFCFAMAGLVLGLVPKPSSPARTGLYVPTITTTPAGEPTQIPPPAPSPSPRRPRANPPAATMTPEPPIEKLDKKLHKKDDGVASERWTVTGH